MKKITAIFDEEEITVTPRFQSALYELMEAYCQMIILNGGSVDDWVWGEIIVDDLFKAKPLSFEFGSIHDKPTGPKFQIHYKTK